MSDLKDDEQTRQLRPAVPQVPLNPKSSEDHDSDALPKTRLHEQGASEETLAPAESSRSSRECAKIPGYEIIRELGRGGMGVVYQAKQLTLNRVVALKMILNSDHADSETRARFLNEAEAVAKLHHPNIVEVHDFGEHEGTPYFSMGFCPGGSLAEQINGHPLPSRTAASIVEKLARGIDHAHRLNIIHRDLKPANVLFDEFGEPRISDFGLAKQGDNRLTASGVTMGTPAYMAPEQASGQKSLTHKVDIYALGAILFECLTGRPPFEGGNSFDTLLKVTTHEPPAPRSLNPNIPVDLETICVKCLSKEPDHRYISAEKLADDLRRFLEGRTVAARPLGPARKFWRWCKRYPAIAGLIGTSIMLLLMGTITSTILWRQAVSREIEAVQAREEADLGRQQVERQLMRTYLERGVSLCVQGDLPRGLNLLVRSLQAVEDIRSRYNNLSSELRDELDHTEAFLRLSLDDWVAEWPIRTRALLPSQNWLHKAAFSPDGRILATCHAEGKVALWNAETGENLRNLENFSQPQLARFVSSEHLIVGYQIESKPPFIRLISAKTGEAIGPVIRTQSLQTRDSPLAAEVLPNGKTVVRLLDPQTLALTDLHTGENLAPPIPTLAPVTALRCVQGRIFWGDEQGQVWMVNPDQPEAERLVKITGSISLLAMSPDGQYIFAGSPQEPGAIWDVANQRLLQRLNVKVNLLCVAFSKDSHFLALSGFVREQANSSAQGRIIVLNARSGEEVSVCSSPSPGWGVLFDELSERVIAACEDAQVRIWRLNGELIATRRNPTDQAGNGFFLAAHPNGRTFCMGSTTELTAGYLFDLPARLPVRAQLTHPGRVQAVRFTPAGNLLTVGPVGDGQQGGEIRLWKAGDWSLLKRKTVSGPRIPWAISPDCRRLILRAPRPKGQPWEWKKKFHGELCDLTEMRRIAELPFSFDHVNFAQQQPLAVLASIAVYRPHVDTGHPATLINTDTGQTIATFPPPIRGTHADWMSLAAIDPAGNRVFVTSSDLNCRIGWLMNAVDGRLIAQTQLSHGHFNGVRFNPVTSELLTQSRDREFRILDGQNGEIRRTFVLDKPSQANGFLSDGRFLWSIREDKKVGLWDLRTTLPIGPFRTVGPDPIAFVEVSLDNLWAAAYGPTTDDSDSSKPYPRTGFASVLQLPRPRQGTVAQLRTWIEALTGMQHDDLQGARDLTPGDLAQRWRALSEWPKGEPPFVPPIANLRADPPLLNNPEAPPANPPKVVPAMPMEVMVLPPPLKPSFGIPCNLLEDRLAQGKWTTPQAGSKIPDVSGEWTPLQTNKLGEYQHQFLNGGYLYARVNSTAPQVVILSARSNLSTRVNGEVYPGNPYNIGQLVLPVRLKAGDNDLLFQAIRGQLHAEIRAPLGPVEILTTDSTLPDLIVGEALDAFAAVPIVNATESSLDDLFLEATIRDSNPVLTPVPTIGPLNVYKASFRLKFGALADGGEVNLQLRLKQKARVLAEAQITLEVKERERPHRRTFISSIDESTQYYSVYRANKNENSGLVLTLHGASVEATSQINSYTKKDQFHLIAPTNRRPFGFDWEEWGRLDALEVLSHAKQQFPHDPRRVYLTGHSMGGHGVWHVGLTHPELFAALAPSAGWASFFSYTGAPRKTPTSPVLERFFRAVNPSDTTQLIRNSLGQKIYILHGDKDDNVPVSESRLMRKLLEPLHPDLGYHEEPGAGHWWGKANVSGAACLDWPDIFGMFTKTELPKPEDVSSVEFATASPGVSPKHHWVTIAQQDRAMEYSRVKLDRDRTAGTIRGTTSNVQTLGLDCRHIEPKQVRLTLDKQELSATPRPDGFLWLRRSAGLWAIGSAPSANEKSPNRYGLFRSAFRNRVVLVYPTAGTPEENAWGHARARLDSQTFWLLGNGALRLIPDTAEVPADCNVILYGHADCNCAFGQLLDSPLKVRRGEVQAAGQTRQGEGYSVLFAYPRKGSHVALVGVIGGTGLPGMRQTERLTYFSSRTAYPDWLILAPGALGRTDKAILAAGYFDNRWQWGDDHAWQSE